MGLFDVNMPLIYEKSQGFLAITAGNIKALWRPVNFRVVTS
jgi:hypothetical protein